MIGRVAASKQKVKVLDLLHFSQDYHIFVVTSWPWVLMGESFHRLIDHLWELVLLNKNYGLANQSEQSLESSHKVEKSDREYLSHKINLLDNLTDVFIHKWSSSDPVLRSFDRQPICKTCDKKNSHWTVSCPMKNTGVMSGDDKIVESLLIQDGEPEPRDQVLLYEALIEYFKKKSDEERM